MAGVGELAGRMSTSVHRLELINEYEFVIFQ